MQKDLKKYADKAISYAEYNLLFKQLAFEERTTGLEQTKEKIDFTKLNYSRTKRLDKTAILPTNAIAYFKKIETIQTWLVITEAWCGDAAQTLPFLNKIAETNPNIDLKILLRDENESLMNMFLTNGSKSIPKLIVLDTTYNVITTWGPRSINATNLVIDYKNKHGKLDEVFKKDLQIWYNNDKGLSIINDLLSMIKNLQFSENISE